MKILFNLICVISFFQVSNAQIIYNVEGNKVLLKDMCITVLEDNLFRIQEKGDTGFVDRSSKNVHLDAFSKPSFKVKSNNSKVYITTGELEIVYQEGQTVSEAIDVVLLNSGIEIEDITCKDNDNLGGIFAHLQRVNGDVRYEWVPTPQDIEADIEHETMKVVQPPGLISKRGWVLIGSNESGLYHYDVINDTKDIYFLAYGNDYKRGSKTFFKLSGEIPMMPKWALGAWFSRYQPLSAQDYYEIVDKFRKYNLPLDVIICDMNWHKDGWNGFRYDEEKFPDMQGFLNWTKEEGLFIGFNHHNSGVDAADPRAKDFIKGIGLNPDSVLFTTTRGRQNYRFNNLDPSIYPLYYDTFVAPLIKDGVDFIWPDIYPNISICKIYFNKQKELTQNRVFVLTRAENGTLQHYKYMISFAGDTFVSWKSIASILGFSLGAANCGFYWSDEVGGHLWSYPNKYGVETEHKNQEELFARWMQMDCLSSVFRLHASGGTEFIDPAKDFGSRQPWKWGQKVLKSAQVSFGIRYKYLPYYYTLTKIANEEGILPMRAMYINYPDVKEAYQYGKFQYMVGDNILVAPITHPSPEGLNGSASRKVWIPEGIWYDYFTGEKIHGPKITETIKSIYEFPLYIKGGELLTCSPTVKNATQPLTEIILELFSLNSNYTTIAKLYEDDNLSYDYQKDLFRWTKFEYSHKDGKHSLIIYPKKGSYKNELMERSYQFIVHNISRPKDIKINHDSLDSSQWEWQNKTLIIHLPTVSVLDKTIVSFF